MPKLMLTVPLEEAAEKICVRVCSRGNCPDHSCMTRCPVKHESALAALREITEEVDDER